MTYVPTPNIQFTGPGLFGPNPYTNSYTTINTYDEITAAGYINSLMTTGQVETNSIFPSMLFNVTYDFDFATQAGTFGWFSCSIDSNGVITLIPLSPTAGTVTYSGPLISGDFAVYDGTSGVINDPGFSPSNASLAKVVMSAGSVTAGQAAVFKDVNGSIGEPVSGSANTFVSYSATASKGALIFAAVANTGNTNTTVSNAAMGQASVISIPDPGAASANFALAPAALVSGNFVKASGTTGLLVDGGAYPISGTSSWGGGGTSHAFTATGVPVGAILNVSISAQANTAEVLSYAITLNTITVTFSADPGAGTVINYNGWSAAIS